MGDIELKVDNQEEEYLEWNRRQMPGRWRDLTQDHLFPNIITYYVTISNDVAMCTYLGVTMHNDFAMNLFYNVFSAVYLIMILLLVVWNKNKNKFMFDRSGLENECVLPRLIKNSLVLVILSVPNTFLVQDIP